MPEPGRVLSRQVVEQILARAKNGERPFAEEARTLARSHEQLREALEEVHEFQCGCDRPGSTAKCVAKPEGTFAVLSADDEVRFCICGHAEWQHVWNSVKLPDGRGAFSVAPCTAGEGCSCKDWTAVLSAGEEKQP